MTNCEARIRARCVDLRTPPFDGGARTWAHPDDYGPTQAFAPLAREAEVDAIVHASVRDPLPAWCIALLTPAGVPHARPEDGEQTWWLRVTPSSATWRRDGEAWTWTPPARIRAA